MSTKKETTQVGVMGALQKFQGKLEANSADLPHLEVPRAQLRAMLTRFEELSNQQGAMRASKQEASKEIQTLVDTAQQLGSGLRAMVKIHYGRRSEKLTEFDLQPFRGRKAKAPAPETGTPAPTPQSPTPPPIATTTVKD
ncbi:MAG TPA: hypothetical protein VGS07_23970 [Thermoanaerobaculia bacterium]|jgi:hypothetical protein|nr:hypothetical protein [Thermoanaerobaculia bacterium]